MGLKRFVCKVVDFWSLDFDQLMSSLGDGDFRFGVWKSCCTVLLPAYFGGSWGR
jgi:hypothetical protein